MRTDKLTSGEGREKHESYAVMGFSRVSSSPAIPLFGSSIKHGHYIKLSIRS